MMQPQDQPSPQLTAILNQAEELFLNYGIRSVAMDDIARKLGMSKKTLYQYVDNKDDLVMRVNAKLILEETADIHRIFEETENAIEQLWRVARMNLKHLRKVKPTVIYDLQKYYGKVWKAMQEHNGTTVVHLMVRNLRAGQEQGLYRKDFDPITISKMHIAACWNLVNENTFPLSEYPRTDLFVEYIKYHVYGVVTERGREVFEKFLEQGFE